MVALFPAALVGGRDMECRKQKRSLEEVVAGQKQREEVVVVAVGAVVVVVAVNSVVLGVSGDPGNGGGE